MPYAHLKVNHQATNCYAGVMKRVSVYGAGIAALLCGLAAVVFEPRALRDIFRPMDDALRRLAAKPVQSSNIVILDIDDESLDRFGQWPWPRTMLANLIERLYREGAAIVAWDIVFAEPDRTSPRVLLAEWRRQFGDGVDIDGLPTNRMDHDRIFADALSQGISVLSFYGELELYDQELSTSTHDDWGPNRFYELGKPERYLLPTAHYIVRAIDVLREQARGEAFFNTLSDDDNIVRRTPMLMVAGERLLPSLSLEVFRLLRGEDQVGVLWDTHGWPGVAGLKIGKVFLPTDVNGCIPLNYRATPFPHVSVASWWNGQEEYSFSNRVIFVGTSAAGLRDLVGTPMGPDVPGVEVHATALDNMLAGDVLRHPNWVISAKLLGITVAGLALVIILARYGALIAVGVAATALALGWGLGWYALAEQNLLLSPAEYTMAVVLIYVSMTTAKYAVEEREKRRVRRMFSAMVSRDVLTYLEEHPEEATAQGRRVEATVFFSDITHFTALAERLDPDELTRWMNRYLTPMAEAIMAEKGYVDKFNGDAIMAVWGVPFPVDDHAVRACRAALEQVRRLKGLQTKFRQEFGMELHVRMGINTGLMTAGNMGSDQRHQYTVMGDSVNVAARLQEANKELGTTILVGEETWRRVKEHLPCRCVGPVAIRGRAAPVVAYELLTG